jgi:hypothetical protein
MKRIKWKLLILLPVLCLFILLPALFIPYRSALVFHYQNTDKVLAFIPLERNDTFKIRYTHSIHLTDVEESYRITENRKIRQYELMYENYAIGMPENASEGEKFVRRNGKFYIKNMNRVFPFFDLRTGQVRANHRVIVSDHEYPLSDYIKPGTWIRIRFEKMNLIQQMKGANILEP